MMIQDNVRALIFDFGNVIINIDFDKTFQAFRQLFTENYETVMEQWENTNMHVRVESNLVTAGEMAEQLNSFSSTTVTENQIRTAWNALLLDLPHERIELLQCLKQKYSLYLLSNTNHVHIREIFKRLTEKYGRNPLLPIFNQLFFSYEMNAVKPQPEIYKQVLSSIPFSPGECLFFDDLQENLDGAKQFGIQTQLVTKENDLLSLFQHSRHV